MIIKINYLKEDIHYELFKKHSKKKQVFYKKLLFEEIA